MAGADRVALAMARGCSSEQGEGCCHPSSAPEDQEVREPLCARAGSEAAFPRRGYIPWRDGGRRGDAALMEGTGVPKGAESSTASARGKNKLFLGKRQRREDGEIKPDPVTGDR